MDRIRRAVWVVLASGCGGGHSGPPPEIATVTEPGPSGSASKAAIFDEGDDGPKRVLDIVGQRLDADTIRCSITWQRIPTPVDITVTPRCCPPHPTPCPPTHVVKATGEKVLMERLKLRADGTSQREALEWITRPPPRLREPYCGRRPEGFALGDRSGLLEGMAELEAASILAFDRPARMEPARPLPVRDLLAIARENAVEGCVNETYGALVATFQAERAATSELRQIFGRIAHDERRHARLAARVHRWAARHLSTDERRSIATARHEAIDELIHSLRDAPPASNDGAEALGLPSAHEAARLCDVFFAYSRSTNASSCVTSPFRVWRTSSSTPS